MDIDLTVRRNAEPWAEHERLRAAGGPVWSDALGGWLVTSYDGVKQVLSDARHFTNEGTPVARSFAPQAMLVTDSPLHHTIRGVWARATALSSARAMADSMQSIADDLLLHAAARLQAGEVLDLVPLFERFTGEVIALLMDIPRDRSSDFRRWNRTISDAALGTLEKSGTGDAGQAARAEVYAFLAEEADKRRAQLRAGEQVDDMIALMVAAEEGGAITPAIALDNLVNLFLGPLDTTVRWLGNVVVALHRRPDIAVQVRADRDVLGKVIEEVMRLDTVIQLTQRIVLHDGVVVDGQVLQAGQNIYALPGAANRDPAVFADPHRFDLERKPKLHMGFGFGMHQCLGMNIARQEAVTFIGRMLDLLPALEITQCSYSPTWSLWGPEVLRVQVAGQGEKG